MNVDLIPCPDCGTTAEVQRGIYRGTKQVYSYVHCTNPLCQLSDHTLHFTAATPEESDRRAALSWNERYADTLPYAQAGLLDAAMSGVGNGAHI